MGPIVWLIILCLLAITLGLTQMLKYGSGIAFFVIAGSVLSLSQQVPIESQDQALIILGIIFLPALVFIGSKKITDR